MFRSVRLLFLPLAALAVLAAPSLLQAGSYTVQPGDTLSELAARFETTQADLLALNPSIRSADLLLAGARITLPDGEEPAVAAPAAPASGRRRRRGAADPRRAAGRHRQRAGADLRDGDGGDRAAEPWPRERPDPAGDAAGGARRPAGGRVRGFRWGHGIADVERGDRGSATSRCGSTKWRRATRSARSRCATGRHRRNWRR